MLTLPDKLSNSPDTRLFKDISLAFTLEDAL